MFAFRRYILCWRPLCCFEPENSRIIANKHCVTRSWRLNFSQLRRENFFENVRKCFSRDCCQKKWSGKKMYHVINWSSGCFFVLFLDYSKESRSEIFFFSKLSGFRVAFLTIIFIRISWTFPTNSSTAYAPVREKMIYRAPRVEIFHHYYTYWISISLVHVFWPLEP